MVPGVFAGRKASSTSTPWSAALKFSRSSLSAAWPTYLSGATQKTCDLLGPDQTKEPKPRPPPAK